MPDDVRSEMSLATGTALAAHDRELSQLRQKCDYLERLVKNIERTLKNHLNASDPARYLP